MKWRERHELFAAAEIIFRSRWPGSKETGAQFVDQPSLNLLSNLRMNMTGFRLIWPSGLLSAKTYASGSTQNCPLNAGSVTERWHSCAWLAFASILRLHVIGNAFGDRLAQVRGPRPHRAA